jgi:hypothetical protein
MKIWVPRPGARVPRRQRHADQESKESRHAAVAVAVFGEADPVMSIPGAGLKPQGFLGAPVSLAQGPIRAHAVPALHIGQRLAAVCQTDRDDVRRAAFEYRVAQYEPEEDRASLTKYGQTLCE